MNSLIYAFPWPWFYLMTNLENELKGGIVMLGGGGGGGGGGRGEALKPHLSLWLVKFDTTRTQHGFYRFGLNIIVFGSYSC